MLMFSDQVPLRKYLSLMPAYLHEERLCRKLAGNYCIRVNGVTYRRIYHYHIRKTGGTSINFSFLESSGEPASVVRRRMLQSPTYRAISDEKVFLMWLRWHIRRGYFFFAHAHWPLHQLKLPRETFTITCLRNPMDRLLSHYRMLVDLRDRNIPHPCSKEEERWIGTSFSVFIRNIPRRHLMCQLHMFSERFDVEEAYENIRRCSFVLMTETLNDDMSTLSSLLELPLRSFHVRKGRFDYEVSRAELSLAREFLEPEYMFYEKVIAGRKSS